MPEHRDHLLKFRCSARELRMVRDLAEAQGRPLSEVLRELVRAHHAEVMALSARPNIRA